MAKHVKVHSRDEQSLVVPAASRAVMPQLEELLKQFYGLLGQTPPANMTKTLHRARTSVLSIVLSVELETEARESKQAQLRRLLAQEAALVFKKKTAKDRAARLQKELSEAAIHRRNIRRAIKASETAAHTTDSHLVKTRKLVTRVRAELAETAARKNEPKAEG